MPTDFNFDSARQPGYLEFRNVHLQGSQKQLDMSAAKTSPLARPKASFSTGENSGKSQPAKIP
jgi:hypothetical protein